MVTFTSENGSVPTSAMLVEIFGNYAGQAWLQLARGRSYPSVWIEYRKTGKKLDAKRMKAHFKGQKRVEKSLSAEETDNLANVQTMDKSALEAIPKLSPKYRSIAEMLLAGYTQVEIARKTGENKMKVSRYTAGMIRECRLILGIQ